MKSKYWIFPGLILIVVAIVFAVKRKGPVSGETVAILGEDSSNLKAYHSLDKEFATGTGISLKFEGATFEQATLKADNDFHSGGHQYDIVLQYNFSLAPYVKNNYVAAVSDVYSPSTLKQEQVLENSFPNAVKETCFYYSNPQDTKSPPKQFGFPFAANTMLLVYNKTLFDDPALKSKFKASYGKDLAVPQEWSDYILVAEFFTKSQPDLKGVCVQGAPGSWLYYELCNYLFGMGTGTSSKQYGWEEDKPVTIASAANEQVLNYYKRLQKASSGDFFTVDAAKQREIMLQGKTAMALMWSDYIQPLAALPADKSLTFGFATVPGRKSGLAGGAFYINRHSLHKDAAARFILFALEQKNQEKLIERGLCSPLRTAYTDHVLGKVPYARALRDSLERGVFMFEAGANADIISNALTTQVQRFIRGEITASEALKLAQNEAVGKSKGQ